jgi:cobalt/nickel transport system permease protein
VPLVVALFAAGLISDWGTYAATSLEMSSAIHGNGSFWAMFATIALAFAPTQIPLGIAEGVVTAIAYQFVLFRRPELLNILPMGRSIAGEEA